jgi:transposase
MMGRLDTAQVQFFYQYRLDDLVPGDHLVRKLDAVLDLSGLRSELAPFYSHTGRPSIDPELMLRMLIVGYVFAIRSERQLCSELQVNLAYRWFCRLSLESRIPDHSVFSRARHERFREADLLRRLFETVVEACIASGLVGGDAFSVDASLIKADVNASKRAAGDEAITWSDREQASRAVREYLIVLDEESGAADWTKGGKTRKPPMAISLTDPQATWIAYRKVRSIFAYHANYLLDHKRGIIVDAEGNRANRIDENQAALAMIARVARRFALKPKHLAADTAYGNAQTLKTLVEQGIEPHIPVWDKSQRKDGTFSRADFQYDGARDIYICPSGKTLKTSGRILSDNTRRYLASTYDCGPCPLKSRCCPNTPQRKIPRDINEDARDYARSLAKTEAFEQSRRERKKVEMAFAHMKRIFKLDRLRLRGLSGARDEVLLTATAQNLRKLAKYASRPPPPLNPA